MNAARPAMAAAATGPFVAAAPLNGTMGLVATIDELGLEALGAEAVTETNGAEGRVVRTSG